MVQSLEVPGSNLCAAEPHSFDESKFDFLLVQLSSRNESYPANITNLWLIKLAVDKDGGFYLLCNMTSLLCFVACFNRSTNEKKIVVTAPTSKSFLNVKAFLRI